ncbi:MAG: anthranilate synthase component I family protein [Syntrophomonadaceae bacterium]|jgi:anthranilate synthase component 1|nr:anthranilate synthase component I family protein [Syntrophomonadaceae bacterium]
MYKPDFIQLQFLRAEYKTIPVSKTMDSIVRTPVETFKILKNLSRQCFILESMEDSAEKGRYTFLGYDPQLEITCSNGRLRIRNGAEINVKTSEPAKFIKQIIDDNRSPAFPHLPPFAGGLVGYFSYDYIKYSEPGLKLDAEDQENFKDVDLMLFNKLIAYDNLKNQIILVVNIKTDALEENYNRAVSELDYMQRLIEEGIPAKIPPLQLKSPFQGLFDEENYCRMVEKAKQHIKEGDIFQVVLSNRLEACAEGSLFDTYRLLRKLNPSPYMFYFSSDDLEIAGASPETLVKLRDGVLRTFPLAGTRPRGQTEAEDLSLEKELLNDQKELAEHNMLVDLGRNDLGRISEFSSVKVVRYLSVERFSHVMHIGSEVEGRIKAGKSALDAIEAVLPAGTLSGAPKIRACEIINALENNKRGIYGGAVGYISLSGNMDTCIAIRIAFKKNGKVFVRSGAGIVADSIPRREFQECRDKTRAVINALTAAEGGLKDDFVD